MRKRLLTLIICLAMLVSFTACGSTANSIETETSVASTVSVRRETTTTSKETVKEEPVAEPEVETKAGLAEKAPEEYDYSVTVSINPQITLYVDNNEDGEAVVKNYKFDNEDAKKAYGDLELQNLKSDDAIKLIIKTASEKEYLKEDGNVTIDIKALGEEISAEVIDSFKETAEAVLKELNRSGEIIIADYESDNKKVTTEEVKESSKEVAKADVKTDDKKSNEALNDSKKSEAKAEGKSVANNSETITDAKNDNKKETEKAHDNAPSAADTSKNESASQAPETCDHSECSPVTHTGKEYYDEVDNHTDTWYTIRHMVRYTGGTVTCLKCGKVLEEWKDPEYLVSSEDWYYESDSSSYDAVYNAAFAEYASSHPYTGPDYSTLDENGCVVDPPEWYAYQDERRAYAKSVADSSIIYKWVQH